jgi:hypothetical protein
MTKGMIKKFGVFFFGLLLSNAALADFNELPIETRSSILAQIPKQDIVSVAQVSSQFNEAIQEHPLVKARNEVIESWPRFAEFDSQFVKIPHVTLPKVQFFYGDHSVAPFVTSRYPITRQTWVDIMGEENLHLDLKTNWKDCPECPITLVAWENEDESPAEIQEFLKRLNEKTAILECTYDLPTDPQLWATLRGDETGENQDPISKGVVYSNMYHYITFLGNSDTDGSGPKIQPVGHKRLNAFEIELGNVVKMSKSDNRWSKSSPNLGRTTRGNSWVHEEGYHTNSEHYDRALPGRRYKDVGFVLVRNCK